MSTSKTRPARARQRVLLDARQLAAYQALYEEFRFGPLAHRYALSTIQQHWLRAARRYVELLAAQERAS